MNRTRRHTVAREWGYAFGCLAFGGLILMLGVPDDYKGNGLAPFVVAAVMSYLFVAAMRVSAWAYRTVSGTD